MFCPGVNCQSLYLLQTYNKHSAHSDAIQFFFMELVSILYIFNEL